MGKAITFVGLDVHKDAITVAVAGEDGPARALGAIPNRPDAVARLVRKLGRATELRVCYEAGQLRRVVDRGRALQKEQLVTDPKYAAFTALDPFFDIVLHALAGLVDGDQTYWS